MPRLHPSPDGGPTCASGSGGGCPPPAEGPIQPTADGRRDGALDRAGRFRFDHGQGQRPQPLHNARQSRNLPRGGQRVLSEHIEQVFLHEADDPPGHALELRPQVRQLIQDVAEGDTRADEFRARVHQTRARDADTVSFRLENPQLHRLAQGLGSCVPTKHVGQLSHREVRGRFGRPGADQRVLESGQFRHMLPRLDGMQDLADVAKRIAALQQLPDEPKAREVEV